jgi:hypothetical protein
MLGFLWRNLKWVGLALTLSPLLLAFGGYTSAVDTNELLKDGVETVAEIEGGKRKTRRRSGSSFSLNLTWKDTTGKPRTATDVSISREIADTIIVNDLLTIDTIKIRYLPNNPDKKPVLASSVGPGGDPLAGALAGFTTALPIALLGGGLFWFLRRREGRATPAA